MRLSICVLVVFTAFALQSCGGSSSSRKNMPNRTNTEKGAGKAQASIRSGVDAESNISVRKIRTYTKKEQQERKRPSFIPGLTNGQLDDMPTTCPLPLLFALQQTSEQLDAHAMITAREDVHGGMAHLYTIEQRFAFIQYVWNEEWDQRKDLLNGVKNAHEANASRLRKAVGRNAAWQRMNDDRRRKHQRNMDQMMREELPVLTPEESSALRSL
ncbi:MAG: hypothetical protein HRU15_17820 [Planctomycetes bacterium]|nr:hypothetical protein [Planctomycetota bacterium]